MPAIRGFRSYAGKTQAFSRSIATGQRSGFRSVGSSEPIGRIRHSYRETGSVVLNLNRPLRNAPVVNDENDELAPKEIAPSAGLARRNQGSPDPTSLDVAALVTSFSKLKISVDVEALNSTTAARIPSPASAAPDSVYVPAHTIGGYRPMFCIGLLHESKVSPCSSVRANGGAPQHQRRRFVATLLQVPRRPPLGAFHCDASPVRGDVSMRDASIVEEQDHSLLDALGLLVPTTENPATDAHGEPDIFAEDLSLLEALDLAPISVASSRLSPRPQSSQAPLIPERRRAAIETRTAAPLRITIPAIPTNTAAASQPVETALQQHAYRPIRYLLKPFFRDFDPAPSRANDEYLRPNVIQPSRSSKRKLSQTQAENIDEPQSKRRSTHRRIEKPRPLNLLLGDDTPASPFEPKRSFFNATQNRKRNREAEPQVSERSSRRRRILGNVENSTSRPQAKSDNAKRRRSEDDECSRPRKLQRTSSSGRSSRRSTLSSNVTKKDKLRQSEGCSKSGKPNNIQRRAKERQCGWFNRIFAAVSTVWHAWTM
ncbi:hypothetical protein BKA69DRAFT_663730 [Paraphysoderma sedebokerense]|nr:hypothetical protein BKA69DRAFT_663730 [Paraphysoderma sedebokerense]